MPRGTTHRTLRAGDRQDTVTIAKEGVAEWSITSEEFPDLVLRGASIRRLEADMLVELRKRWEPAPVPQAEPEVPTAGAGDVVTPPAAEDADHGATADEAEFSPDEPGDVSGEKSDGEHRRRRRRR